MIAFFIGLLVLILIRLQPVLTGFNDDYLSRDSTASIKGIFVLLVFFSHFRTYVDLSGNWYDAYYSVLLNWIGQLMVVMFLFYSGYGILRQIVKNRKAYIASFLSRRLAPVWLRFAACVFLFLLLDAAMGRLDSYSLRQVVLAFTGWTAIGNSNWYMFVTFALYGIVFVSFRLCERSDIRLALAITTAFSGLLVVALYFTKASWWWNTLLCFPLGMWYGLYRERIDRLMEKRWYWLIAIGIIASFFVLWLIHIRFRTLEKGYILLSLLFALSVVCVTMKVRVGNKLLRFFGAHTFSLYMLQRLPMIFFQKRIENVYLYFVVCFAITLLLSVGFDLAFPKVNGKRAAI